jgi:hypothetical protein
MVRWRNTFHKHIVSYITNAFINAFRLHVTQIKFLDLRVIRKFTINKKALGLLGSQYLKATSSFRSFLGQRLASGQLAALPLISTPLPPSPGIILVCHLSPSSHLPSSFLNLCSLAPHLKSIAQHFLSPPLLLEPATP